MGQVTREGAGRLIYKHAVVARGSGPHGHVASARMAWCLKASGIAVGTNGDRHRCLAATSALPLVTRTGVKIKAKNLKNFHVPVELSYVTAMFV